jgi:ferric-dicitrate binding protein FerR (iron transport regulator)
MVLTVDAYAQTATRIGVASAVRNQVTAQTSSQQRALAAGGAVYQNDTITTGASSVAQLLFADQTTLSVGPRSEIRLDRYVYDPSRSTGDVAVSLTNGALRFISGRQDPRSYQIQTPVATIGVRGTIVDFLLIDGRMFAILAEGRVIFTLPNGRTIELNEPGKAIEFFADSTTSAPFTWRGRYEAGLQSATFPLFGNPFADMLGWEGADDLDDSVNHTDELQSDYYRDIGQDDDYYDDEDGEEPDVGQ